MSLAEIAYKAAGIMSERGFCQFTLQDEDRRVCHQGALMLAVTGRENVYIDGNFWGFPWNLTPEQYKDFNEISDVSREILASRGWNHGVVDYNNDPGTTGEDVILLLKEAAAKLEEC